MTIDPALRHRQLIDDHSATELEVMARKADPNDAWRLLNAAAARHVLNAFPDGASVTFRVYRDGPDRTVKDVELRAIVGQHGETLWDWTTPEDEQLAVANDFEWAEQRLSEAMQLTQELQRGLSHIEGQLVRLRLR